jgi:hypothetical protein
VASRDITEGRSTRAIAVDIGLNTTSIWQNTGNTYDCAVAGIPFLSAIRDDRPYERTTAPFRKQQFDSQRDPGEQSLSNWWLRSQSSFHAGEGILFYDPLANPYSDTISTNSYRIKESYGVDIWTQGQVSLLHDTVLGHITTEELHPNKRPQQTMRSITWTPAGSTTPIDGYLLHDGTDVDRIHYDGTVDQWIDNAAGQDPVYAITDDGQYAYWITNDSSSGKLEFDKKSLAATSGASSSVMFTEAGTTVRNAVVEYVKQRLVLAANNKIYEFPVSQATMPTAVYTHPNTSYIFTSIAASGTAIYVSGYNGSQSSIFKFILTEAGAFPTLTSAITAAELPFGEVVHKLFYYLGYMCIGTSLGIRIASIDAYGSLTYGPLIVETSQPCYDFAARDRFIWCATGVNNEPGVLRIDLSLQLETLRFAYAHDVHYDAYATNHDYITTACAFIGNTDSLAFASTATVVGGTVVNKALASGTVSLTTASAHGLLVGDVVWVQGVDAAINTGAPYTGATVVTVPSNTSFTFTTTNTSTVTSQAVTSSTALVKIVGNAYSQHPTNLRTSGYIETGLIRYNTLEPKNFKRVIGRGNFAYGSMSIQTRDINGNLYDLVQYDAAVGNPEVTITQPIGAQDALGLRFVIYRDPTTTSLGSIFKGYQLKAVPATPRNRLITIPLMNFDTETDKYNTTIGYEGRAIERLAALENAEANGDVVSWQDFRTGEIAQALIEEVKFTDMTPPDKRYTGYGGIITLTIRTV